MQPESVAPVSTTDRRSGIEKANHKEIMNGHNPSESHFTFMNLGDILASKDFIHILASDISGYYQ